MQNRFQTNCVRILFGMIGAMITTLIGYISTPDIKNTQKRNDILIALSIAGFILGVLIKILQEKCSSELIDDANERTKKINVQRISVFSQRLNAIDFDQKLLPENFIDPIDFQLMDNPVMLKTSLGFSVQRYDNQIAKELTICPFSRERILDIKADKQLKKDIIAFIDQQERNFNQRKNLIIHIEEKTYQKNHNNLHIWKSSPSEKNLPERDDDVSEKSPLIYKKVSK